MQESTRLRLQGQWDEVRGRIRSAWGELTDDDVDRAKGDLDRLVGIIKRRTGESLAVIHRKLDELVGENRPRGGRRKKE